MNSTRKTAIVTGASQGVGAGIVKAFVERGFNVVANSRNVTQSTEVAASDRVALVDGHIGEPATAARIVETALARFESIDVLVNNAGIFFTKPFTDYTAEDFKSLVSTNLGGFLYITQLAIKQMLAQKTGGSIVTITAALARNPIRGVTVAVPMMTKGGLETVTQHLALEYTKEASASPRRARRRPHAVAVVRLGVYIAATAEFTERPKVADAASELLRDVFGDQTVSSRLVFGVASLPLGSPVELEVILEVKP